MRGAVRCTVATVQYRALTAYSLSRESAEKIKNQLSYNRARLHTPEDIPERKYAKG